MRPVLAVAAVLAVVGCSAAVPEPETPSPYAACTGLTAARAAKPALPDITLACFTGGEPVRLADLRGPALVNIWQTACGPCREELPAIQRLADRTTGRLTVLGVIGQDTRTAAASFGTDFHLTFPNLDDPQLKLQGALGRPVFPITLLVAADGSLAHTYIGAALDDEKLDGLVRQYLPGIVP